MPLFYFESYDTEVTYSLLKDKVSSGSLELSIFLTGTFSTIFLDLVSDIGALCRAKVVKEGNNVVELAVIDIALPSRQDDHILLVELCLIIGEIDVNDVLNITIQVAQILNVLAILQKGDFTTQSGHDHHVLGVQGVANVVNCA